MAILVALCGQSALAPQAQAIVARTGAGHLVSYQPTRGQAAHARGLAAGLGALSATRSPQIVAATYKPCNGTGACLTYYGGPVMLTTVLTAVFWNPEGLGLSYPANYKSEIEQFIADVAADSGRESDFFSVLPQYYEATGGKTNHLTYSVSGTPAQTDTAALPSGTGERCTAPPRRRGRA